MSFWVAVVVATAWLVRPSRGAARPLASSSSPRRSWHAGASAPAVPVGAGDAVPSALNLLALAMRSGVGHVEAIEAVAGQLAGPLGAHLHTVAAAIRWGVDEREAWASVPTAWQPAAWALRMAASAGVPPAELLVRAAGDLRRAEDQRLEMATSRLAVLVVLPLGLAFLPAFVLTTVLPIVLALAADVLGRS